MIYETVQITVAPEQRDEFIEVYKAAWKQAAFAGSHAGKVMRALENPARVDVIIEWDSLAAHRHVQPRRDAAAGNAELTGAWLPASIGDLAGRGELGTERTRAARAR